MESRISALLQEIVLSNPARTFLFIRWALEVVRPLHLDAPLAEMGPFLRGCIKWCRGVDIVALRQNVKNVHIRKVTQSKVPAHLARTGTTCRTVPWLLFTWEGPDRHQPNQLH